MAAQHDEAPLPTATIESLVQIARRTFMHDAENAPCPMVGWDEALIAMKEAYRLGQRDQLRAVATQYALVPMSREQIKALAQGLATLQVALEGVVLPRRPGDGG